MDAVFGTYGVAGAPVEMDLLAQRAEEIAVRGFTIIEDLLSSGEVDELNAIMDRIYTRQCEEVGGEAILRSINDADIVRCILAYDEAYMRLALNPAMVSLAQHILGENIVLIMQNGIINRPERVQFQTKWHRDLNYQHWVNSQPLSISALVCLEDFNNETGGTVFLPGSHRFENFPSDSLVLQGSTAPEMRKGSVVVFDSMVFHRAGLNRSQRIRRGVNHVYGRPILAQQVDVPAMLDRAAPEDAWLSGFLGYRWNPVSNVAAWRRRKSELIA